MGKKSRRKSKVPKTVPPATSTSRATSWGFVALLLIGGAAGYALWRPVEPTTTPTVEGQTQHERQRPFYENPEEARPFPAILDPSRFGVSFVSRAYAIARRIPEVLVQQPCDCNCGVLGHRRLLDCYVSYHAANCAVCLKEAVLAQRMTAAGRTPVEIREDIDKGFWRAVDLEASTY